MFETLFTFIDNIVTRNIGSMVGVFTSTITPLIGACVILYAIYLAYQSLYDQQNLVVMESMKFIGSLAAVTFIALNTEWYLANIVPAVLGSGDQIAQALLGSASGGGAGSLQAMYDNMIATYNDIWDKISIDAFSPKSWLAAIQEISFLILNFIGCVPFLAVSTAYLLVAKVMVGFLLIIGPLFIMMAFFPSTRSFFQAWTGQCFNYTLLSIMYPLAFTIFTQVLQATIFESNLNISTFVMSAIIYFALILLSVQIPTFCSTLSGGIGINGLVGGAMGATGGLMNGFKGAGKGAAGAFKGGIAARNWAKNRGKGTIKPG